MANNIKITEENGTMLTKGEAFFTKNWKKLAILLVLVLVAVGGYIGYKFYSESKQEEASTAIAAGQNYFMEGKFTEALSGDKKGFKGFVALADEYSSTKAGNLAKLYAGLCSAELGKWEDAVKYLEDFSQQDDVVISPLSQFALANAYVNTKQLDKAVETFKKAASNADSKVVSGTNNSISPLCLHRAAEVLVSQKKDADALALYNEIKTKYPASALEVDKYIQSLEQK